MVVPQEQVKRFTPLKASKKSTIMVVISQKSSTFA